MPRDHAGWAWSTSAEQELGCGVYGTVGFETAKLQCHQPCPLRAWGQYCFPAAAALLTGHLLSTQRCWGRQGKEVTAVTTRVWGRQWHSRREEAAVRRTRIRQQRGLNTKMQTSIKSLPEGN